MSLLIERPHLPTTAATWAAALFLGLLCSGVAFVVQTVQQQYTTASHVGLIFTLEPVFASIVAFVLGGERLPARGYVGAALMLLSLVMMEVDLDGLLHKRRRPPRRSTARARSMPRRGRTIRRRWRRCCRSACI